VLKRGLIGVYHHASEKHLHRYVDEFAFRLNDGNVSRHTLDRLDSFVDGVAGKRLTYSCSNQITCCASVMSLSSTKFTHPHRPSA
jgi:hypothetical protein